MQPPTDPTTFVHGNVIYRVYIEERGERTPADPRMVKKVEKLFQEKVGQRTDVAKAAFEAGEAGELRASYYDRLGSLITNTEKWKVEDRPTVAKVHEHIRLSQYRAGKRMPTVSGNKVGIERKQQTCYAGAFLQLHVGQDLGKSRTKPTAPPSLPESAKLTQARDELWEALKAFQDAAKIAKKNKKTIEVKFVAELLSKAAAVEAAHGIQQTKWDKLNEGQDFSELWAFVHEELNMPALSDSVYDQDPHLTEAEKEHMMLLNLANPPPTQPHSVSSLLAGKTFGSASTAGLEAALNQPKAVAPELLPLKIDRNPTGQKDYTPLDIDRELTYTVNGKKVTYELAGAVEHLGDTNKGHNIAYTFEKGDAICYDDERAMKLKPDDAVQVLKTTVTFLIYRKK